MQSAAWQSETIANCLNALWFCRYSIARTEKKEEERVKKRKALQNGANEVAAATENQAEKSDEEDTEGKPKKEKLGFRDRKVNTN